MRKKDLYGLIDYACDLGYKDAVDIMNVIDATADAFGFAWEEFDMAEEHYDLFAAVLNLLRSEYQE